MRSHLITHTTYSIHTRHNIMYRDRTGQDKVELKKDIKLDSDCFEKQDIVLDM